MKQKNFKAKCVVAPNRDELLVHLGTDGGMTSLGFQVIGPPGSTLVCVRRRDVQRLHVALGLWLATPKRGGK